MDLSLWIQAPGSMIILTGELTLGTNSTCQNLVDDITVGWTLQLGGAYPKPKLRFHAVWWCAQSALVAFSPCLNSYS